MVVERVVRFGSVRFASVWGLVGHRVHPNGSVAMGEADKRIVISRSHAGQVASLARAAFDSSYELEKAGGAGYKLLRVLNGTAALYLHRTYVKKWDLCAGDALIRAAGGRMTTLDGSDLTYFANDPDVVNKRGLLVALRQPFTYLARVKAALTTEPL